MNRENLINSIKEKGYKEITLIGAYDIRRTYLEKAGYKICIEIYDNNKTHYTDLDAIDRKFKAIEIILDDSKKEYVRSIVNCDFFNIDKLTEIEKEIGIIFW